MCTGVLEEDKERKIIGGAVYLAGWTVTDNQLSYCPEGTSIGQEGTFGIYPKGISAESLTGFNGTLTGTDKWVLTAGNDFGITANGTMFSQKGEIAGWEINEDSISKGNIVLISSDAESLDSLTTSGTSPLRFGGNRTQRTLNCYSQSSVEHASGGVYLYSEAIPNMGDNIIINNDLSADGYINGLGHVATLNESSLEWSIASKTASYDEELGICL